VLSSRTPGAQICPNSKGHRKRVSRILRRSCPEVVQAFQEGLITAKRADLWLYLPIEEQRTCLQRYLSEREKIAQRSKIAAAVIRTHIDTGSRDLVELRRDLQLALCSPTTPTHG